MNTLSADDRIRHEAALAYANGDTRKAISLLIQRINDTNGHCSAQVWLCILDVYQAQQQQAAYEKLAVFFSNRFHYSPPAWDQTQQTKPKQTGQWRNALIIEGSPMDIREDKVRDFVRASREAGESRLDISRMRLDANETVAQQEMRKLLNIMERLRRVQCPTMFMGDAELLQTLRQRTKADPGMEETHDSTGTDVQITDDRRIYWMLLFEVLQWRGLEDEFDQNAMTFAEKYAFCPVGFDRTMAIAVAPTMSEPVSSNMDLMGFEGDETVLDAAPLLEYAQSRWDKGQQAEFQFMKVNRVGTDVAQSLAALLQAQTHPDGIEPKDTVFYDVNEIVASLFEATGVSAFATLQYRHEKLRHLLEV